MRSLPDIANQRIDGFTSAISAVRMNVMVKGFLGPTVRDDDKLPSVGQSAARRAGIILDENGKMRCPPGTPNANQFTDMQMSNCMVPSAETVANAAAQAASSLMPSKTSPKLVAEFAALGIDIDDTLKKDRRRLSPEQKAVVKKLAWAAAYWGTFFGDFGDLGMMINDITTATGDSDNNEGIEMLTSMFVSGGMASVKVALANAKEKWNKTKEQVNEYQEAFAERMKRLRIKGGELSEKMQDSLNDVMKSIKERVRGISVNEPTPVDRAVGKLTDASDLVGLPQRDHATSQQIKDFNAEMLAKAPKWGHVTDEDIKEINDSKLYEGKVLTLSEHRALRREKQKIAITEFRQSIESGTPSTQIDPITHQFILTHSDEEVIDAIEATALKIAKSRKAEASVIAKQEFLESVLTDGYRPMRDTAGGKEGDTLTALTGGRGRYEASVGAFRETGVRPVYGFSKFTFWDDELKKKADKKNAEAGREITKPEHFLAVHGLGGAGNLEGGFVGLEGYGDMEIVLHPETADRTAIHHADSLLHQARGASAVGATDEELIEAYVGHGVYDKNDGNTKNTINSMLRTHITGDLVNFNKSGNVDDVEKTSYGLYTEAEILGGFSAADIQAVKFDGTRLFPTYKNSQFPEKGGVDGAELIQKIEEQHLSTEQLLAAGFTQGEIELAREKIAKWATSNAGGNPMLRPQASMTDFKAVDDLIMKMEQERIEALVKEKAPHVKVLFGSSTGSDLSDPTFYKDGKAGDRVVDIFGARLRTALLEEIQREIQYAAMPDNEEETWS